ncbi:hypothetical protein TNCV_2530931 [Trichonephila clavipes]|nr:hypothetical protein TNCV_2530931 [Trichonephila clavipes]
MTDEEDPIGVKILLVVESTALDRGIGDWVILIAICGSVFRRHTSKASQLFATGSFRMSEPLTLKTVQGIRSLFGSQSNKILEAFEIWSMLIVGKTMPFLERSCIVSISVKKHLILVYLPPPRSPTREAVCRSSGKYQARAYLEYAQNIVVQHQGEDSTGKPSTNSTELSAVLTLL